MSTASSSSVSTTKRRCCWRLRVVLGYNTDNFDMPYLNDRAEVLGIGKKFRDAWGRMLRDPRLKIRDRTFGTTAIGMHEYKEVTASGILFYDLFQYLKRNPMIKLRSYSLNSVAKTFIDMEKENVAYSQIAKLQTTPDGRRKLLSYCIRDALLPVLIDAKKTISHELLEKSRGTGVPIEMLLKRGMQIQCKTYLYRKSRLGMLVPTMAEGMENIKDAGKRRQCFWYTRTDEERRIEMRAPKFEGAKVIDPKRGLHEEPVGTLDFRSLYPSIVGAGNYCLLTLLAPNFSAQDDAYLNHIVRNGQRTWDELFIYVGTPVDDDDPEYDPTRFDEKVTASSCRFLRHDILRGFVPDIERELLEWRDVVKAELKAAKGKLEAANAALKALVEAKGDQLAIAAARKDVEQWAETVTVLDKRQLSIKLIANSLYGVFGAKTSFAMCLDLADSVTRRGRAAIMFARYITEHVVNNLTPESADAIAVSVPRSMKRARANQRKQSRKNCRRTCASLSNITTRQTASAPKTRAIKIRESMSFTVILILYSLVSGLASTSI
jgi:DNA polymerase elongation subunit (family B)